MTTAAEIQHGERLEQLADALMEGCDNIASALTKTGCDVSLTEAVAELGRSMNKIAAALDNVADAIRSQ